MKSLVLGACRGVLSRSSSRTRTNFCLDLLNRDLIAMEARGDWSASLGLRKRVDRRFVRGWPCRPPGDFLRAYGLFNAVSSVRDVPGDIVECGVGRGLTLVALCYANAHLGMGRTVYGFDSFEGFPDAGAEDVGIRVPSPGGIPGWADTDPELILQALRGDADGAEEASPFAGGVAEPVLVRGLFGATLAERLPGRVAFLHLDADLYESTHDALSHCLPRLSPGALVVFDELHETDRWPGVAKAVRELCEPRGLRADWLPELQRLAIRIPWADGDGPPASRPARLDLNHTVRTDMRLQEGFPR